MADFDYLSSEATGIDYLYSLAHAQNNLFFAKVGDVEDSIYRISKISVSSPKLSFETNNNRFLDFKKGELPDEVSITWIEDEYRSVEQFHMKWMREWYNFAADFIPIGRKNKFKDITIYAYHYINKNNSISAPLMDADPTVTITLLNCVPTDCGQGYEFDWSQGGIKEFTTTYKFTQINAVSYANNRASGFVSPLTSTVGTLYSKADGLGVGSTLDRNGPTTSAKDAGTKPEEAWSGVGVENNAIPYSYLDYIENVEAQRKAWNDARAASQANATETPGTEVAKREAEAEKAANDVS